MSDLDLATVERLLTTTRAVRRRLDLTRPVPRSVITDAVRAATQAPSAGDVQAWRWVAVTDPGRRRAIADVQRAGNVDHVRAEAAGAEGSAARRLASAMYLLDHLHEVPVHVIAYAVDPGAAAGSPLPPRALWGSIYPAVWSFQLALRARGLGTTPLLVTDEAGLAAVVGAPATAQVASLLPVAYYTGETFQPAGRRPVDEVLTWDRWGEAVAVAP